MPDASRPWQFPMQPRNADERARWEAEQQRRLDLQAGAITSVSMADMPGPLLIGACIAGGMACHWLAGGATR